MKNKRIPEKDLKLINDSFKQTGAVDTLGKNGAGKIVDIKKKIVNEKTITFNDFSGRILRHQKSIVIKGQGTVVLGVKGQKYDDIPLDDRKLVIWFEDDFEKLEV